MSSRAAPHDPCRPARGNDPLDLQDVVAAWHRQDVARATARLRATIRAHERVAYAAACQIRMIVRFTAVIAITDTHLYVAFARPIAGTHAVRLTALRDISKVRSRGRGHLLIRGERRSWKFSDVEPAGRAAQIAEHLRASGHDRGDAGRRPRQQPTA